MTVRNLPILMYHSISDTGGRYAVSAEEFSAHMLYLREAGHTVLKLSQISQQPWPQRAVAITFDDGYADFYTTALPVLNRYLYPVTLFVTTGWLGQSGFITWELLREIRSREIEIGSHTVTHPALDRIRAKLLCREIADSKSQLEHQLGMPVTGFAYPYGYYSQRATDAVKAAGYNYACAVQFRHCRTSDNPWELPRVIVTPGCNFAALVAGDTQMLRSSGSRMWRKIRVLTSPQNRGLF